MAIVIAIASSFWIWGIDCEVQQGVYQNCFWAHTRDIFGCSKNMVPTSEVTWGIPQVSSDSDAASKSELLF